MTDHPSAFIPPAQLIVSSPPCRELMSIARLIFTGGPPPSHSCRFEGPATIGAWLMIRGCIEHSGARGRWWRAGISCCATPAYP
jgi:hypothetical protein